MRKESLDTVYELAKKDERIVFIGSDLGKGTLSNFKKEMPSRFFMEGVNEQNIVGMAAGMALEGKVVYINTIATFLTRRCFEQVVLDLCLHKTKVRLIASGGGLVYAPLGPTHLAIEDLSILRPLPNMTIISVADAAEMVTMLPQTVDIDGPVYIRLGKGNEPEITRDLMSRRGLQFKIGEPLKFRDGKDAAIVTTGVLLKASLDAAENLEKQGISASVVHVHTLKPMNEKMLLTQIAGHRAVVTVEENVVTGGLGSAVAELIAESGGGYRFKRIGLPDRFPEEYGSQNSLLSAAGVTAAEISQRITSLLRS